MRDLVKRFSTGDLQTAALQMVAAFNNNGDNNYLYSNVHVSDAVSNSNEMKNFVKKYGELLNEKFKNNGFFYIGEEIITTADRPVLNSVLHSVTGLQICINDIEECRVSRLDDLTFNTATGEWECTIYVELFDHYGLDRHDALKYQVFNNGFAAWWRLQHRYNNVPFITYVPLLFKIKGKI